MGFADIFNKRPSPGGGNAPVIHMPSLNACSKFNIARRGADSRYYVPLQFGGWGFLRGVQFTDIRNPLAGLINPNLLSLTKPEIPRSDRNNAAIGGIENYLMDELILEFIGNLPYTVKPEKLGTINSKNKVGIGLAYSGPNVDENPPPPEAIVRIVPSDTDWLKFSTNHTWDDPSGIISKVFDVINGIAGAVGDFANVISKVSSTTTGNRTQARLSPVKDVSDSYISSEKQEITIPFTLFTAAGSIDDFMNDIYFPVMLMNIWSSPRRALTHESLKEKLNELSAASGLGDSESTQGGTLVGNNNITPSAASEVDTSAGQAEGQGDNSAVGKVLEVFTSWPGYRIAMLAPPSYIRVSHSSGLFSFPKCAISGFEYNYKGPWVNTNSLIQKMQLPYSVLVGLRRFLPRQIPTVCECSLNIKVLDNLFADDWLAMFNNSSITKLATGSGGLVNVLNGRPSQREANGFNFPVEQF